MRRVLLRCRYSCQWSRTAADLVPVSCAHKALRHAPYGQLSKRGVPCLRQKRGAFSVPLARELYGTGAWVSRSWGLIQTLTKGVSTPRSLICDTRRLQHSLSLVVVARSHERSQYPKCKGCAELASRSGGKNVPSAQSGSITRRLAPWDSPGTALCARGRLDEHRHLRHAPRARAALRHDRAGWATKRRCG
jgi:hypothetical protein